MDARMPDETRLLVDLHVKYIQVLDSVGRFRVPGGPQRGLTLAAQKSDEFEYWLGEHLRLSGLYWGLVTLDLMGRRDALNRDQVVEFVRSCQHPCGGFAGSPGHDPHMLYTLSALQVLAILDRLDAVDTEKAADCV